MRTCVGGGSSSWKTLARLAVRNTSRDTCGPASASRASVGVGEGNGGRARPESAGSAQVVGGSVWAQRELSARLPGGVGPTGLRTPVTVNPVPSLNPVRLGKTIPIRVVPVHFDSVPGHQATPTSASIKLRCVSPRGRPPSRSSASSTTSPELPFHPRRNHRRAFWRTTGALHSGARALGRRRLARERTSTCLSPTCPRRRHRHSPWAADACALGGRPRDHAA